MPSSREVRSLPVRIKKMRKLDEKHLKAYIQQVTKIKLPFTLKSLQMNQERDDLETVCQEKLGPNMPAQCMSAQFVDSEDEPILFYFGDRILLPLDQPGVSSFPLSLYIYTNR